MSRVRLFEVFHMQEQALLEACKWVMMTSLELWHRVVFIILMKVLTWSSYCSVLSIHICHVCTFHVLTRGVSYIYVIITIILFEKLHMLEVLCCWFATPRCKKWKKIDYRNRFTPILEFKQTLSAARPLDSTSVKNLKLSQATLQIIG